MSSLSLANAPSCEPGSVPIARKSPQDDSSLELSHGLRRIASLALLFAAELIAISVWLDTASLTRTNGLTGLVGDWGPPLLRSIVAVATVFLTFAYLQSKSALQEIFAQLAQFPIAWGFLAGHFLTMGVFGGLSSVLFGSKIVGLKADSVAVLWLLAGGVGIALAAFAFIPLRLWLQLVRTTGRAWAYALGAGVLVYPLGRFGRSLWNPAISLTFSLVKALLHLFIPDVVADRATFMIGSERFRVVISPQCSGFEGAGLMLVFGVLFLVIFHRENRFPQALLLLPAGVIILWLLNAVRIAVLILIGNAGAKGVALGGFHSQAGWIAFNLVAVAFCVTARRVPWLTVTQTGRLTRSVSAENAVAPYLVPFLTILAAGMISRAFSSGFEWLYPLRFFAAAAALWFFRHRYAKLDWRFGWFAVLFGSGVFVLWLALDRVAGTHTDNGIASGLAAWPGSARMAWLVFRTLAAVVTVPIAEELAFRGYLLRRLISSDFEAVGWRRWTYVSVLGSSLAFGLMHGDRWLAGTVAGLLYAAALLRRGRIGDAVAAHATTNALLSAWVLFRGNWYLW